MDTLEKIHKKCQSVLLVIIGAILSVMMLDIVTNVVTRFIFNFTISWSEELARYLFVQLIFLGACYGIINGIQIRIDLIDHIVENKPMAAAIIQLIQQFVSIAAATFLMVSGANLVKIGLTTLCPAMQLPMYWWYLCIPVGAFFCVLELAIKIVQNIKNWNNLGKETRT